MIYRKDDKNSNRTILIITSTGAAIMKPASDTMDRIYAAADSLFEQSGRSAYPTVDAVRKAARTNMNDANSGMREWRRNQMARAVPAPVQVPTAIMEAQATLAVQVWQAAQAVAGESLAVAQAAWDAERSQLESLNREMADAFEVQAAELDALNGRMRAVAEQAERAATSAALLVEEVGRRADELRRELCRSHRELAAAHAGGRAAMAAHADELAAVRADARQTEAVLREELEALRAHQRELMQIVSASAGTVLSPRTS
ncbi:DNA-binding protein [Duganella sp. BuS-21]|uniref:DNA-binding protein n=1 Tax=Duganella sp. BuS-21 TaxID=2943848 RepID=UPI0035A5FCED